MPQTATRPATRQTLKAIPKAETPAERNTRLYGCPLDHTPNAETMTALRNADSGVGLHKVKDLDELRSIMVGQ
jgi:hypothetical protein